MGHEHAGGGGDFPAGRRLAVGLALNTAFLVFEAVLGVLLGSLALLGDAAHNFSDSFALVLSLVAVRMSTRPPTLRKTYGYHRLGILAAFINSLGIILVCFYLFYEALRRLAHPVEVAGGGMVLVAGAGFLFNGGVALLLLRGKKDLNIRSAFLHLFTDALVSLGVVVSGAVIMATGWTYADPLVTMVIGLLILVSAFQILRESTHILMESVPAGVDYLEILRDIRELPGVRDVHDLHIWEIGARQYSLSAHVVVDDVPVSVAQEMAARVKEMLLHRHRVVHATLELESDPCAPGEICPFE
ncbi:MAG: cation transporter [Actinobacteria bacterium]|nr:cation transporter [Actinomycetota bacterium]